MAVAPDSTSYPTLAVIQHFGLAGETARIVWDLSDLYGQVHRGPPVEQLAILYEFVLWGVILLGQHLGSEKALEVDRMLWANVARAVAWCRENAAKTPEGTVRHA